MTMTGLETTPVPAATRPRRRLVLVVRADPVICGHSVEARNLAEVALTRGFDDVRIVTWPIDRLVEAGLPLKPMHLVEEYSEGITVERPDPIGDYKIPDGRHTTGMVGRLVELFTDGVPTVCMSLYLLPHAVVVNRALAAARATGLPVDVTTIAEAVGSDITNSVRAAVREGRAGVAADLFATYLAADHPVAVSRFTKELIVDAAVEVDALLGTSFATECEERVRVSYPAIDGSAFSDLDDGAVDEALAARGLERDGYLLFLSRLTPAKGADDLIEAYGLSTVAQRKLRLVVAGNGPSAADLREFAVERGLGDRVLFLDDVGDAEKPLLMRGSAAYVLPSKPRPEFVETFGIALAEQMLSGGGPVITTSTGGIPEAVGNTALVVPVEDPVALASALDEVTRMGPDERERRSARARTHALQFDRVSVFDRLFGSVRVMPATAQP